MKYRLSIVLLLIASVAYAQRPKARSYRNPFLSTQWYLGFFAGGNLAKGIPVTTYSGYAPLNYDPGSIEKTYSGFTKVGPQAGLVFMFYTKGFTIAAKPGVHTYRIEHSTSASWIESVNTTNALNIDYTHTTKFNYVEFPLTVQYDLLQEKIRPYIGVGGYYGLLINASRTVQRSGTDSASGSSGTFTDQPKSIGINDLYIKSSVGVSAFVGASYDPGNIRITLDIGYKFGLNNITNTENRYVNNELTAIGEAMDDLNLQNLYMSIGFVFPLKFISKNYLSLN
jgi:outer membrane protein W